MKKLSRIIGVFVLSLFTVLLASCGPGKGGTEIAILIPGATHGWPVGVVYYANESAKKLEKDYNVKVITATSSTEQANQIEDLLTEKSLKGIVILPFDNDVKSAVEKIANKKIPFVMFDRVIDGVDSSANVQGDNHGIGYETAKIFVQKGLEKGAKILEMPGDNSSVPTMRSDGFRAYLTEQGWTAADLGQITKTDFTGWSRENSRDIFQNWIDSKTQAELLEYEFIFTHDDEIALGVMDVLKQTTDKNFDHVKVLASSAGKQEYYIMLNGKTGAGWADGKLPNAYLFSVTYPPYMIQDSVNYLMDILNGKNVAKEIVIPVNIVDSANAKDFLNPDSPY